MKLTTQQKEVICQIVNVAETGKVSGEYSQVTIARDGPDKLQQISYGKSQVTEFGKLDVLLEMYIKYGGKYATNFVQYMSRVGDFPLSEDEHFLELLHEAGSDPIMHQAQDDFFDLYYFNPALVWAKDHNLTLPLSMLVIYDSFIHSGGILQFLRNRFPAVPPNKGGEEKTWIRQYLQVRHEWLILHSNPLLVSSSYRTKCYLLQAGIENWDLSKPVTINGIKVKGVEYGDTRKM